jgi:restriction endonuclease
MKALTLLAAMAITFTSCNCQKKAIEKNNEATESTMKQEAMPTLEYEANTRGFFRKITVVNQMVSVINVRDGKATETKISDADWKELTALYKSVNKEGLSGLKAPSEKRFYDGAPIANFRVITKENTFESAPFDGGFPPAEIEKIVNKLIAIADKQE